MIAGKLESKPEKGRNKTPFMKQVMEDTGIKPCMELKKQ